MKAYLLLFALFCAHFYQLIAVDEKILTNATPLPLVFRISPFGLPTVNLKVDLNSAASTTQVTMAPKIEAITVFFPNQSSADLDVHNRCIIIKKDVMGTDPGIYQHFAEYFKDQSCKNFIRMDPIGVPMANPVK